jgi:hypothetical protein
MGGKLDFKYKPTTLHTQSSSFQILLAINNCSPPNNINQNHQFSTTFTTQYAFHRKVCSFSLPAQRVWSQKPHRCRAMGMKSS